MARPHPLVRLAALGISQSAIEELERCCDAGAAGVTVLANIAGRSSTDPLFASIWEEIDRRALPDLVHPTNLPGIGQMQMKKYDLS
jgi:aminocarboxymuconate-semialdehyde decarboxylase